MQNNKQVLDGLSSSLVAVLTSKLNCKDFGGAISCYEQRAESESDGSGMAETHHLASKAYLGTQDLSSALKCARLAQAAASKEGDSLALAEVFMTLGAILRDSGQVREALRAYTDAESIFRRNDNLDGRCRALNLMAGVYFKQTDYRPALSTLLEALEMAQSLSDRTKIAYMMGNIGRIHTFLGDLAEAERHLKINIDLSNDIGDQVETARAYLSLGYAQMQRGDFVQAEKSFETAYPMIVASGNRRDEAIYLSYRGELQYRKGCPSEALITLEKAQAVAEKTAPETTLVGRILRQQAEAAVRLENYRLAQRLVARALPIMGGNGDRVTCGALWKLKAMIADSCGQTEVMKTAINKSLDLLTESGVRYELAEALLAAGQLNGFSSRQRLTYLFRAEEYYASAGLLHRHNEVQLAISATEANVAQPSHMKKPSVSDTGTADYITCCPQIEKFKSELTAFGRSDLPVLLTGETGVGKDQMAKYFHSLVRPTGPFVAINCASVPETLLESELFGYVRGAFTGAEARKKGLFESANGGVLFLDEIGDMPLSLQAKLLGVIERRRMIPLGSITEVELDVKLVAATNQNLELLVEQGNFRKDLYYRLSGISFHIPALRDRREDIPLLATHFLRKRGLLSDRVELPCELVRSFMAYDWPGNIRELDNRIRRVEVMALLVNTGDLLGAFTAVFSEQKSPIVTNLFEQVEEFERKLLVEALRAAGGNKSAAARILGVHEATVRTKLRRYGLEQAGGAPTPGIC